jgi:tetratricopeptide (TPR) repeat protein
MRLCLLMLVSRLGAAQTPPDPKIAKQKEAEILRDSGKLADACEAFRNIGADKTARHDEIWASAQLNYLSLATACARQPVPPEPEALLFQDYLNGYDQVIRAERLSPATVALAQNNKAILLLKYGRLPEAIAVFKSIFAKDDGRALSQSDRLLYRRNLAMAAERTNDWTTAFQSYTAAIAESSAPELLESFAQALVHAARAKPGIPWTQHTTEVSRVLAQRDGPVTASRFVHRVMDGFSPGSRALPGELFSALLAAWSQSLYPIADFEREERPLLDRAAAFPENLPFVSEIRMAVWGSASGPFPPPSSFAQARDLFHKLAEAKDGRLILSRFLGRVGEAYLSQSARQDSLSRLMAACLLDIYPPEPRL